MSKGIVFRSGSQLAYPSTRKQLSIAVDSDLAQKLAPNARIVVWYITGRGEIVSDSLDFTVNASFANEVKNFILNVFFRKSSTVITTETCDRMSCYETESLCHFVIINVTM